MTAVALPSGTVTFVFTDVEGSTRLLHELGAGAYAEALAEHRRVVRAACSAHGGAEVDTQGDAFFFAFSTAPGALAAAAALTEGLTAGPIKVRVGVHTGTPLVGEEGYVGHDVHRAARIAAAGHGGQILVSAATAALVRPGGSEPQALSLVDLGEHRFKDLGAPERVYQLGDGNFPALESLYRTNLPIPATPFLGRAQELADVVGILNRDDVRLLTLTGPGGTGKTRLSLQSAAEVSDTFPDGVFWVSLAPLRDASLLETTFAQALEVSEQPRVAIADSIVAALAGKRALVVVDNCEHLVDAVADLLRKLVEGCPRLVVVASSRERLGLRSERVFSVPPMAPTDSELLFVERARAVEPAFEPDERVAEICEAVDGLPLAIELAAARVRSLSTKAILERLDERLGLLASRDRDVDERQRTLEATIAWSYDLLDPEERRILRALSAFAGGCTLEAAERGADADLDVLESLLDKSLLRHRVDEAGQDRYWMLETIREYAATQLELAREAGDVESAHRSFFTDRAAELFTGELLSGEEMNLFEADRANFRVVLLDALADEDGATALRLAAALGPIWFQVGELADSYALMRSALALTGRDDPYRGPALRAASELAAELGELGEAHRLLDEADAGLATPRDDLLGYRILNSRVWLAMREREYGRAADYAAHAADAGRAMSSRDLEMSAIGLHVQAIRMAATDRDDPDIALLERCLALMEAVTDWAQQSDSLTERAAADAELGMIHIGLGNPGAALDHMQSGLRQTLAMGLRWVALNVMAIGVIAGQLEQHETAAKLTAAVLHQYEQEGTRVDPDDARYLQRLEPAARNALGDAGYEAAVRAGAALTRDEAVELALGVEAGQSSAG